MRLWLVAACAVSTVHAGCVHTGKSLNLDEDSFDDEVLKGDHLLTFVEFSSPWCIWANPNTGGHGDCATMRKAWDGLAKFYDGNPIVRIAEVDCSRFVHHPPEEDGTFMSRESLCQRYDIKSYPTVLTFTGETMQWGANYTGKHTLGAMKRYLEEEIAKLCVLTHDERHDPTSSCNADEVVISARSNTGAPVHGR